MIFWLAKLLSSLFGWDIVKLQKRLILGVIGLILIAILCLGLWAKSCWTSHKAKLNEKQIVAAQQAIAKQDREEMTKVLVDVAITEKNIDANLANSDSVKLQTIYEARKKAAQMDNAQLAAELERLTKESQ